MEVDPRSTSSEDGRGRGGRYQMSKSEYTVFKMVPMENVNCLLSVHSCTSGPNFIALLSG